MGVVSKFLGLLNLEYKYGGIVKKRKSDEYHKPVTDAVSGNAIIFEQIATKQPKLIARLGSVELALVLNYLDHRFKHTIDWPEHVTEPIWKLAGIFPVEDQYLQTFAKEYIKAIKSVDVMGVWNNGGENEMVRRYCPNASLIPLASIEPYFFEQPWSKILEGKKVLVIHPFEASIQDQYKNNRKVLFKNPDILPDFDLQTVKAVQTLTYNTGNFDHWIAALDYMKSEIQKRDFDIAIIGAGGYGLLLGAFIKSLGKTAVHMGGASQLLFGIKGKRWEDRLEFQKLFNEHWKYPYPSEKPENAQLHENGAYW